MILNMNEDSTRKWIATVVSSSDTENWLKPDSTFSKMVNDPNWDAEAIDFRITMNGYEYTQLDEMFDRLHDHFRKQSERIAELEAENEKLRSLV